MSDATRVVIVDDAITPELVQKLVLANPITGYALMSLMKDETVSPEFRKTIEAFLTGVLKSYHQELRNSSQVP